MAARRSSSPELAVALALALAGVAACSSKDDGIPGRPPGSAPKRSADGGGHGPGVAEEPAAPLGIAIDGRDGPAWTAASFARVEHWSVAGDSGARRGVWSLPRLAAALVGPRARAVRLHGRDGPLEITPEQWSSTTAIPSLRRTGRGELKFQWVDSTGRPRGDRGELPGVTRLELVVDP